MREVSKRVFTAALEALVLAEFDPGTVHRIQAEVGGIGSWATWDEWVEFLRRLERLTRDRGGLRWLGEYFADVTSFGYVYPVYSYFTTPRSMYMFAGRWFGNALFPFVDCETVDLGDGRLKETLRIPEFAQDSPEFFDFMLGAIIVSPRFIGLPDAYVEMRRSSRAAEYVIVPPPPMSLASRWVRSVRSVLTGQDQHAMKLFSHLIGTLQERNRDLEAECQRAEARNEALTEALEENRRMTEALAKAREELEFRIQEQDGGDALMGRLRWLARGEPGRQLLTRMADFIDAADASDL